MGRGTSLGTNGRHILGGTLPSVSVVLPTYNGTRYLAQSIQSVIDQTLTDWELIVVDDASTEDVHGLVAAFREPRIHYVRNAANCRLPRSLNRGFALAAGQYLTWTSDDNWYAPDALKRMRDALDGNDSIQMVYGGFALVDENGLQTGVEPLYPAVWLPNGNCVGACFLYRRRVLLEIGSYNPDALLAEDYEYWLRVHSRFPIGCIKDILYYYRIHGSSLRGTWGTEHIAEIASSVAARASSRRRVFDLKLYLWLSRIRNRASRSKPSWLFAPTVGATAKLIKPYERYC